VPGQVARVRLAALRNRRPPYSTCARLIARAVLALQLRVARADAGRHWRGGPGWSGPPPAAAGGGGWRYGRALLAVEPRRRLDQANIKSREDEAQDLVRMSIVNNF
jgi:hypothetical protein